MNPFLTRFWISDSMKASSLSLKGYWYLLVIGRFDAMFIDIPKTVLITSISDVNSSHLCKDNLIQPPWNLSPLSFRCAFIWSTSLTCRAPSKGINISFYGACCPSCSIMVCWYVGVLTCDETGVVCSGLFLVFVVYCKIWLTFFVFALVMNSSSGTSKRFGSLTALVDFEGVFFLGWSYLLIRILFDFPFAGTLLHRQLNLQKASFWNHHWYRPILQIVVADIVLSRSSYTSSILDLLSLQGKGHLWFLLEETWWRFFLQSFWYNCKILVHIWHCLDN